MNLLLSLNQKLIYTTLCSGEVKKQSSCGLSNAWMSLDISKLITFIKQLIIYDYVEI